MKIPEYYNEFRQNAAIYLSASVKFDECDMVWVKTPKISSLPIVFENNCVMYLDESSLPINCSYATDLSNKYVLYGILCNGKFYIGCTSNFGERMSTHTKDSKKNKAFQKLYFDMKKKGECLAFVFATTKNKELAETAEHILIKACKDYSVQKACNFNENSIKFVSESKSDYKEYSSKYCYNIVD